MTLHCEELREQLLPRLHAWGRHGIHFGLSPRSSLAWEGLFDRREANRAASYSKVCDTALLHVGPSHVPDTAALAQLRREMHDGFGWTVLVESDHMFYRFPYSHPERGKRGALNPAFLDPDGVRAAVAPLLQHLRPRVIVLRIGPIYRTEAFRFEEFHEALMCCLDALLPGCRYGVEIASPEFVLPMYLESLRRRDIAHVLSGPSLPDAVGIPGALSAGVCMLRSGCLAAEEEGDEWLAVRRSIRLCLEEGKTLYAYLNDGTEEGREEMKRGEGGERLVRLLAELDVDLARRSPIKRRAA
ncbi:MAG: hypothetical protein AB1428_13890 [Bacteroidota bacterium]